jgi:ferredoxin
MYYFPEEEGAAMYVVDTAACIRCGVSSSVAPDLVEIDDDGAHVVRQPEGVAERALLERARLLCPVGAIEEVDR